MKTNGEFKSSLCDMSVKVVRTTDRAALVKPAFRKGQEAWVPLSHVELSANEGTDTHLLTGPHWLFAEKGWL